MCYDEGTLQAYLDAELNEAENNKIKDHVAHCSHCQALLNELKENSTFVDLHLTTYKKQIDRIEPVGESLLTYNEEKMETDYTKEKGVFNLIKKYKKLASAAAAVAVLGASLSFAPVRSVAAQFLTLFRVQNVETTSISIDELNQIQSAFYNEGTKLNIKNFGKVENDYVGERRLVKIEEASEAVGFDFKLPGYMPENMKFRGGEGEIRQEVTVTPENNVSFVLNVDNLNAVIEQLDGKHLLPESLDGKPFTVSVAPTANIYANDGGGRDSKRINITQTKSPEIKLPDGIDAEEVRKVLLDLPMIPTEIKEKLAALDNWQDTLYVPQPSNGSTEEIVINGAKGVIIKDNWGDGRTHNSLMWQNDGVLYLMNGDNIDADEMIKIANSMK